MVPHRLFLPRTHGRKFFGDIELGIVESWPCKCFMNPVNNHISSLCWLLESSESHPWSSENCANLCRTGPPIVKWPLFFHFILLPDTYFYFNSSLSFVFILFCFNALTGTNNYIFYKSLQIILRTNNRINKIVIFTSKRKILKPKRRNADGMKTEGPKMVKSEWRNPYKWLDSLKIN